MKAKEFDTKFDRGESVLKHLDLSKAVRPASQQRRVNVDFPVWMIESLDKEAKRRGNAGAPANGFNGYEYRVDLTSAVSSTPPLRALPLSPFRSARLPSNRAKRTEEDLVNLS